jgi:hypothetical protein
MPGSKAVVATRRRLRTLLTASLSHRPHAGLSRLPRLSSKVGCIAWHPTPRWGRCCAALLEFRLARKIFDGQRRRPRNSVRFRGAGLATRRADYTGSNAGRGPSGSANARSSDCRYRPGPCIQFAPPQVHFFSTYQARELRLDPILAGRSNSRAIAVIAPMPAFPRLTGPRPGLPIAHNRFGVRRGGGHAGAPSGSSFASRKNRPCEIR